MAPRRNNLSNHHTTVTPTPTAATTVDVHNLLSLTVVGGSIGGDQQQQFPDGNSPLVENNNKSNISSPSSLLSGSTSPSSSPSSSSTSSSSSSSSSSSLMMSPTRETTTYIRCCVPTGDCFKMNSSSPDYGLISLENLSDCIRVICNNENCSVGQYMHRDCFESWEQTVLISLKTIGRARSWTDRQRLQNLWTKKCYDLVYKACGCKCGRGHIRKDLDWTPPPPVKATHNGGGGVFLNGRGVEEESTKKKKKRNRNNQKPTLALTTINPGTYHPNSQQTTVTPTGNHHSTVTTNVVGVGVIGNSIVNGVGGANGNSTNANNIGGNATTTTTATNASNGAGTIDLRARAGSLSSSSGTTSPPVSASSELSISPVHHSNSSNANVNVVNNNSNTTSIVAMTNNNSINNNNNHNNGNSMHINGNGNCNATNNNGGICANSNMLITSGNLAPGSKLKQQLTPMEQQLVQQQKNKEVEIYSERVRSTSGCNGIFSRRLDFSSFNLLPKTRLNSYQVKIEDEGNHGNDETRLFILSSLAQSQMSRVACILCEEPMLVFDRYPLVDGSFFLSPKQHSPGCIEVKYEGRALFLTCVCMSCLDGTSSGRVISCRFCGEIWDGSSLVLGTMYAYDIFAAMPCCAERLKCNTCLKLLLHPQQRLNFFSDYSHCVTCPYCATQDTHFVKPLGYCYTKNVAKLPLLLA